VHAGRDAPARMAASGMQELRGARVSKKGHYMSIMPFLYGARYVTCKEPGCMRVRRAWDKQPLIHNGRKPR
jgi:hypothetical protein